MAGRLRPNGAGKSSIGGAFAGDSGAPYFNPDEGARRILAANPATTHRDANSAAWLEGKRLLERAIAERLDVAIETTLGGNTLPTLLDEAFRRGIEVRVWFIGVASADLCLARVRARVAKGGHDIPEADIRRRYDSGRINLLRLLPRLTELLLYDNSTEADPDSGLAPRPRQLLHLDNGRIVGQPDLTKTPRRAKPLLKTAIEGRARRAAEL